MGKPSRFLIQHDVDKQTDQELGKSYFELQKLRQQIRIAECGRVILSEASHDLIFKAPDSYSKHH
jgi:hypothetical protein